MIIYSSTIILLWNQLVKLLKSINIYYLLIKFIFCQTRRRLLEADNSEYNTIIQQFMDLNFLKKQITWINKSNTINFVSHTF